MNYSIDFSDSKDLKPKLERSNPLWNFKVLWLPVHTVNIKKTSVKKQKLDSKRKTLNTLRSVGLIGFNDENKQEIKLSDFYIKTFLKYLELEEKTHPELSLDEKIKTSTYLTVVNSFEANGSNGDLTKEKLTEYVEILGSIIGNCLK